MYSRNRAAFLALAWQAAVVLAGLARGFGTVGGHWRAAMPRLTSPQNWRRYLGLTEEGEPGADAGVLAATARRPTPAEAG